MDRRTERRLVTRAEAVGDAVRSLTQARDSSTVEELRANPDRRDDVAAELGTAVEAAVDVGSMLLRDEDVSVPDADAAVFRELQARGVLDDDTARRLVRTASVCEDLGSGEDDGGDAVESVFEVLEADLDVFGTFLEAVRAELR